MQLKTAVLLYLWLSVSTNYFCVEMKDLKCYEHMLLALCLTKKKSSHKHTYKSTVYDLLNQILDLI